MGLEFLLRKSGLSARWGATVAQSDLGNLPQTVESQRETPQVLLDFAGIDAVNQSYVRQTAGWFVECSIMAREGGSVQSNADPWAVRPIATVGVFVANLSPEVRNDVDTFFRRIKLPCLEALKWSENGIAEAQVLGQLDPQLWRTLDCLQQAGGEAVAEELWSKFSQDKIGVTGWNNRLSELYARHLVNRKKTGKYWRYFTQCEEAKLWESATC